MLLNRSLKPFIYKLTHPAGLNASFPNEEEEYGPLKVGKTFIERKLWRNYC